MTYHLILRMNNTAGITVEAGTSQPSPGLVGLVLLNR